MKTKEYATQLREQGLGYTEIAQETGYSVDWCKKNLKEVQKNKGEKVVIQQAIVQAQSKDGITNGEIKYLVRSLYPVDNTKEQKALEAKAIARFKAAISKAPNTLIRPYWMQPENSLLTMNAVLSAVDNMSQRMTDCVDDIRKQFDLDMSYDNSLRYAIIKMLQASSLVQEGLENHCNVLNNAANELDRRNGCSCRTFAATINTCCGKCALQQPVVEKCIVHEITHFDELDYVLDFSIPNDLVQIEDL